MVVERQGDILTSFCDLIAHQVNCMGVMGAGLAKQIRAEYPEVYKQYRTKCLQALKEGDGLQLMGKIQVCRADDGTFIANCFAQHKYGRGSCQTDYAALQSCLQLCRMEVIGKYIALPYGMGCGNAGGDWNIVRAIIDNVFAGMDVRCEIWRLV